MNRQTTLVQLKMMLITLYLNLLTALRRKVRLLLGDCLGCGARNRLPGRHVCNKCSLGMWQKFGARGIR